MTTLNKQEVVDYLEGMGGFLVSETDDCYKFAVESMEEYEAAVSYFFLVNHYVGKPKPSSIIEGWVFARLYKDGAEVDPEIDDLP